MVLPRKRYINEGQQSKNTSFYKKKKKIEHTIGFFFSKIHSPINTIFKRTNQVIVSQYTYLLRIFKLNSVFSSKYFQSISCVGQVPSRKFYQWLFKEFLVPESSSSSMVDINWLISSSQNPSFCKTCLYRFSTCCLALIWKKNQNGLN